MLNWLKYRWAESSLKHMGLIWAVSNNVAVEEILTHKTKKKTRRISHESQGYGHSVEENMQDKYNCRGP